jgi:hypothetical protein
MRFAAAPDTNVLGGVFVIAMNDRVFQGFAHCNFNVTLGCRDTTALRNQEHELVHKEEFAAPVLGRECSSCMDGGHECESGSEVPNV